LITQFFIVFKDYLIEVLPFLAIGFFLSGLIHEVVPTDWVEKHLSGKGIKPLLYSTIVGTALPIKDMLTICEYCGYLGGRETNER
jgi:uncharacterized membrane protein YraQ (UPF0718 family)